MSKVKNKLMIKGNEVEVFVKEITFFDVQKVAPWSIKVYRCYHCGYEGPCDYDMSIHVRMCEAAKEE